MRVQELDEAEAIGLEDALKMQVKRHMLEKWIDEPFFEATLTGCLVRISFRTGFLAAEVTGVGDRPPGRYRCLLTALGCSSSVTPTSPSYISPTKDFERF